MIDFISLKCEKLRQWARAVLISIVYFSKFNKFDVDTTIPSSEYWIVMDTQSVIKLFPKLVKTIGKFSHHG